ncbi:hypothetical protein B0H16DRAFT_1450618 [Mycena metata]|uniref:Uncharacterized protein n=1 Tax=Mycena metata TaxID=1033252 RepID=A0AAD7JZI4_9AGAR|nr:hypothetical protein B0H16DRAFT_1474779 [Mycena metata]KAJ7773799.1 hypothetical protein B0H16DRAFT_1450618 [Mycena metata]
MTVNEGEVADECAGPDRLGARSAQRGGDGRSASQPMGPACSESQRRGEERVKRQGNEERSGWIGENKCKKHKDSSTWWIVTVPGMPEHTGASGLTENALQAKKKNKKKGRAGAPGRRAYKHRLTKPSFVCLLKKRVPPKREEKQPCAKPKDAPGDREGGSGRRKVEDGEAEGGEWRTGKKDEGRTVEGREEGWKEGGRRRRGKKDGRESTVPRIPSRYG